MFDDELLGAYDCSCSAIRCRTALKLGQRVVYHWRVKYLVNSINLSELAVGVVFAMSVAFFGDPSEML